MIEPVEHRIFVTSWLMDQLETVPIGCVFRFEFVHGLIRVDVNPGDICVFEVIQPHEESEPSYKVRARFCGCSAKPRRDYTLYLGEFELISFELPPCPAQSTP
jgi:hypothetical protein